MSDERLTLLSQLRDMDRHYFNVSTATYELWMRSKRRARLVEEIQKSEGGTTVPNEGGVRQPFTAPYTFKDLAQLDNLMEQIGMDWEWRRSGARERLVAKRDEQKAASPKFVTIVDDANPRRGIQIGDSNVQTNTYFD